MSRVRVNPFSNKTMFIAIHEATDELISGVDILDPVTTLEKTDSYRCLLCNEEVKYSRGNEFYQFFSHLGEDDCFEDPRTSHIHQTGCQKAIKTVCTELGYDRNSVEIEKEIHGEGVGTTRADVVVTQPDPIAIEVYYRSRFGALSRKLRTMLHEGYDCYVICVAADLAEYKPAHAPEQFDESLQHLGDIQAGRYVPSVNKLLLGTRITEQQVDFTAYRQADRFDPRLSG